MRDIDRFFAFEVRRHSLLSTREEPFEGGVAYFDDDYPERYVSGFLLVTAARQPSPAIDSRRWRTTSWAAKDSRIAT